MRFIDPTGMLVDDYFNVNGDYLGKDEAKTDNVKIISQNSWDNLKTVNDDGTETIDHATGSKVSTDHSTADLSTTASLSVYDHYNPTDLPVTASTDDNGQKGGGSFDIDLNTKKATRIEMKIEGNKNLGISNHANEISNIFSHEEKHYDDFKELGFNGYINMSVNQRESRAVQTQMNQSTFKMMRENTQEQVKDYGANNGMMFLLKIPVQGIQISTIQPSK